METEADRSEGEGDASLAVGRSRRIRKGKSAGQADKASCPTQFGLAVGGAPPYSPVQ